jgi:hypothetical protein
LSKERTVPLPEKEKRKPREPILPEPPEEVSMEEVDFIEANIEKLKLNNRPLSPQIKLAGKLI